MRRLWLSSEIKKGVVWELWPPSSWVDVFSATWSYPCSCTTLKKDEVCKQNIKEKKSIKHVPKKSQQMVMRDTATSYCSVNNMKLLCEDKGEVDSNIWSSGEQLCWLRWQNRWVDLVKSTVIDSAAALVLERCNNWCWEQDSGGISVKWRPQQRTLRLCVCFQSKLLLFATSASNHNKERWN